MNCGDLATAIERARRNAQYPATDFGHETGCPDTTSAAHIGRTCQEMIALDRIEPFDLEILPGVKIKVIPDPRLPDDEWTLQANSVPPQRVIALRSNDATQKRNVAALAHASGFAYTESGVKS